MKQFSSTRWPPGSGLMADLIRSHDWGVTPLGAINQWPRNLKAAVDIMLVSGQPMFIAWGPELVLLYNDAYRPILGAKAGCALGRRLADVWSEAWEQAAPLADRALNGESTWAEDMPFVVTRNGYDETAYFTFSYGPLWGETGRPEGLLATVVETTRQVKALRENERLLAESRANEGRLRLAMQSPKLGTWDVDAATLRVQWSTNTLRIFGYENEHEIDLDEPMQRVHADDRERVAQAVRNAFDPALDGAFHQSYRVVWPDGSIRWVESIGQAQFAVRGGKRTAFRLSGVLWDNTAQQQLIESLRETEGRFRTIAEQTEVGVAMTDRMGRLDYVNDRYCRILGRAREELVGRTVEELTHPDDWPHNRPLLERALSGGGSFVIEKRHLRPDGSVLWVRNSVSARRDGNGNVVGVMAASLDLTDRVQAEEQLRRSHETFYRLIQNSPFGVYVIDADFRLRVVSSGAQKVFRTVQQPLGRDFAEVLRAIWVEPFASEAIERFRHTLETGEAYVAPTTIEARRDVGVVEAYDWRIERIALPDGQFGVVCYFYDLSEQKRIEGALRESEQKFRLLADTMPQIVWATRPDGYPDYFNERWYEFTGMPRPHEPGGEYDFMASGQGWNWKDYLHPDDHRPTLDIWSRCLASGAPYHVEYRFKRRDGEYRWFIGRALPLRGEAGRIVRWFGTLTDIHDQKLGEQQRDMLIEKLREADRAKDEFLAMLAHELRNPLAPIRNGLTLLDREPLTELGQKALAMSRRQLHQLVRLVDDLLEVSRVTRGKIELRPEPVMLQHLVYAAADGLGLSLDERRQRIAFDLPQQPVRLVADPVRLTQIIENLLTNASKYTDPGGEITVRVSQDRDRVTIEVRDTGIGIAPDHLPKLFNLFTQVESSIDRSRGGLGIGLALVKRLVELHAGCVTAASDGIGKGATFTVRLPLTGPVAQ